VLSHDPLPGLPLITEINMKPLTFKTLTDAIRRAELALRAFGKEFSQWLRNANWLEILIVCIPFALVVTLLPLVLLLFVLCVTVRWLMSPAATNESSTTVATPNDPQAVMADKQEPASQ
jgi:hypothetical protein